MTSRELEVLVHLARSGGRSGLREIAERLGVSLGYARLLCAALYARYYVEKHTGEVFVLTRTGQAAVAGRGEPAGGRESFRLSPQSLDPAVVRAVAQTLTGAVQRTLQRQLRQGGAGAALPEPIAIKTSFDGLLPDATGSLETNLAGVPQEVETEGSVREGARALRALRGARGS